MLDNENSSEVNTEKSDCPMIFENVLFPSTWTAKEQDPLRLLVYYMMGVRLTFLQHVGVLASVVKTENRLEAFKLVLQCAEYFATK